MDPLLTFLFFILFAFFFVRDWAQTPPLHILSSLLVGLIVLPLIWLGDLWDLLWDLRLWARSKLLPRQFMWLGDLGSWLLDLCRKMLPRERTESASTVK